MPNFRIVAAGGGNPTTNARSLFETGLNLTGAEKPRILLIPTAKYTKEAFDKFVALMRQAFEAGAGLPFKVLHEYGSMPEPSVVADMLAWADLGYFTGGDTRYMMEQWATSGAIAPIRGAVANGDIVACGFSAGALMHFTSAHSDSLSYEVTPGEPWDYISVGCLGNVDAYAGVHLDGEHPLTGEPRVESFKRLLAQQPYKTLGVGIDNRTALVITGEAAEVMAAPDGGRVHRKLVGRDGVIVDDESYGPDSGRIPLYHFISPHALPQWPACVGYSFVPPGHEEE